MSNLKILAIDGSTTSSGIAIFENNKLIYHECITPSGNTLDRILKTTNRIKQIYNQFQPTDIVMQEVISDDFKHNQTTYKALMYLQASIALQLHKYQKIITFYIPSHWRKLCGIQMGTKNKRQALKQQSKLLVEKKYNIKVNDDISDAICIGNAYFQEYGSAF